MEEGNLARGTSTDDWLMCKRKRGKGERIRASCFLPPYFLPILFPSTSNDHFVYSLFSRSDHTFHDPRRRIRALCCCSCGVQIQRARAQRELAPEDAKNAQSAEADTARRIEKGKRHGEWEKKREKERGRVGERYSGGVSRGSYPREEAGERARVAARQRRWRWLTLRAFLQLRTQRHVRTRRRSGRYCALLDGPAQI